MDESNRYKDDIEYAKKILNMSQEEFDTLSYVNPHPLEELMDLLLGEMHKKTTAMNESTSDVEINKLQIEFDALDEKTDKLQERIIDAYNT